MKEELVREIKWELSSDSGLSILSREEISNLQDLGIIPKAFSDRHFTGSIGNLAGLNAYLAEKQVEGEKRFYAQLDLGEMQMDYSRIWWMPWKVRLQFSQPLRVRIFDLSKPDQQYQQELSGKTLKTGTHVGGPLTWARMDPIARDSEMRSMAKLLSLSASTAIAGYVKGTDAGAGNKDGAGQE